MADPDNIETLTVRVVLNEWGQWRDLLVVAPDDKVLGRLAATEVGYTASARDASLWQMTLDGLFVRVEQHG